MFGPSLFPSRSTHLFSNTEFITDSTHFHVPTLVPLITFCDVNGLHHLTMTGTNKIPIVLIIWQGQFKRLFV
jgi:hypothetical protein